ncbi:30S ribosomal protein S1 [Longimicrobium sp.]|uniref:30S ribosomal protein S1 n=1 Tax=Longimicrobium sp. TaxID=2029185 RepID=UPI002BB0B304|nr:30S ribosomal protein S1 [Longimicrobium sp.]HSU16338.1 30S ribosomal protein S1 [Longimicrobium sp.]
MSDQTEQYTPDNDEGGVAVAERRLLSTQEIANKARELNIRADLWDEDEYSAEEYEAMLEMYDDTLTNIEEGEIVQARVLRVTDKAVILDLGFKSEGAVARDEFKDPDSLQIGDEVEVFLENLEDEDGVVVLSKKKADFLRVWEKIKEAHESGTPVKGTLTRKIKGGVTVDLMGVDAFLPGSQIALRRVPNIEDLLGETYEFKIIKLNKRRRNIVVSRRVLLEADREIKRDKLKKELEVGQVRTGVVKNITDFGAFIDLGGMDGLLHITDMSWGRVGHPSEVVSIGAELEVKVLDIDWERERLSLGLKQLQEYPWKDVEKKYPVGARVRGKVVSITNYGAFVELEKGVEGLVHISEMSWTRNVRHPSKIVSLGEEIEAVILKVDPEGEKISLGMKQIEEDPWHALPVKYPVGTRLTGKVRNLTSFGAFVEIEPGIDGLVHISDMSWTKRIQHPSEVVKKGDDVEVVILAVDAENKRISLGLKQTIDDPWEHLATQFHAGQEINGRITRLQDKGVAVDLGDDVEGFVPVSQLGVTGLQNPADVFVEGDELEMRVTEVDAGNRRIVLEVTRVPKFEGGEPIFRNQGEAVEAEAPAAAPEADAPEAPAAEAEAPEAPAAEAAPEEAPAGEGEEA